MSGTDRDEVAARLADDAFAYDAKVLGDSEPGRLTSKALRAFTKASRASLLYDHDNKAVADFLEDLDTGLHRALRHGPMVLEVRPWELLREGELVYQERDREKSLAFRLYRDGVRKLTIQPDVGWDEITKLVGIMSIRYTGIRQQEEDVVTLLWRASFDHVEVETVDSYTPVDDETSETGPTSSRLLHRFQQEILDAQHDFDYPCPELEDWVEVEYRPVPAERLEPLLIEDDSSEVPRQSLQLIEQLLLLATDPKDPMGVEPIVPLLCDVRDFLLAEDLSEQLLESVRLVHRAAQHMADESQRDALLGVFSDRAAFARMVDSAIAAESVPPALVEIAAAAPVEQLEVLLQVIASRFSGTGREIGRRLLADGLGPRIAQLEELILTAPGSLAADLLEIAADQNPEVGSRIAVAMVQRDDRQSKLGALEVLEHVPYRSEVGRVLTEHGLTAKDAKVRCRAARVLATHGEKRAFPTLQRILRERALGGAPIEELEKLGEALARLDGDKALAVFREWVQPQGLLKIRATAGPLWPPAVAGLAQIPDKEAGQLLKWLQGRAEGALKARCAKALMSQHGLAAGGKRG